MLRFPATILKERVLDALSAGFISLGGTEHEIVMGGVGNARASRRVQAKNLPEFAAFRQEGVKLAFNLNVEDAGDGWSNLCSETRVLALDDFSRLIIGGCWRLIVPGSGMLRRQWLASIKRRAESAPEPQS